MDGIYRSWLSNGQLDNQIHYKEGKLDGPHITWYPNGNRKEQISYINDEINGPFISWYDSGEKKEEGYNVAGVKDGVHTTWFENGQKRVENTYRLGKLNGPSSVWYANGQKKKSGFYKNNMPNGLFTQWNENGQRLEDGNYVDGQKDGKYTYWYSNGQKRQELYFKAGKREGESNVWWSNGQKKKSGKNKNDKPIGSWKYWLDNGQAADKNFSAIIKKPKKKKTIRKKVKKPVKILPKKDIQTNFEDGPFVSFYDNGMIKEKGTYLNNNKIGTWRAYNSKGQVLQVQSYVDGELTETKTPGVVKQYATYHDNGRVKAEGVMNNGERDGEWKIYNLQGELEKIAYFDFGELVIERETDISKDIVDYHDNGRVKAEGKTFHGYRDGKWKFYDSNGKLLKTAYYLMGEIAKEEKPYVAKEFLTYHDNGRVKEQGQTSENKRDGEWKIFDSKGNLVKVVLYKDDQIVIEKNPKEIKDVVTYHDNGRIKEQGQTYMGERDGKWKFYNSKGQLSKTIHYLVGDIIKQDTSL